MTGRRLRSAEVAARAGITVGSFHRIRLRPGRVPLPDGRFGREPWWFEDTVDRWVATRLRRGRPSTSTAARETAPADPAEGLPPVPPGTPTRKAPP